MSSASKPIRVLCVDDHPIVREGISGVISSEPDMVIVGEAADGGEALELFSLYSPDVTLMDLQMPGITGIEAIMRIRSLNPEAKVIVLTTYDGDVQATQALKAGAQGYLIKNTVRKKLPETIRLVHGGRRVIPPAVAEQIAEHYNDDSLTCREIEVLQLISTGHSNKAIAGKLSISEDTVKNHVSNVLSKLSANDRTHAVTIALKRGFLTI